MPFQRYLQQLLSQSTNENNSKEDNNPHCCQIYIFIYIFILNDIWSLKQHCCWMLVLNIYCPLTLSDTLKQNEMKNLL